MKINIKCEINGNEVIKAFLDDLSKNNITAEANKVNILITSKDGKEVSITPDRLKIVFNQE